MSRESLWMLGIDYLEYSFSETNEGIGAIEIMLPRIPIKCEKQALKIISIAKTRNLTKVEQEICKIQAKQSMISGRYGNALEWAVRSNDTHCVTTIADFFLNVRFIRFFLLLFYDNVNINLYFEISSIIHKQVKCYVLIFYQILVQKCLCHHV